MSDYQPNTKSLKIVRAAWEHVHSIPYAATSRWLFYRLLQDGFYNSKDDYDSFLHLFSRVRKGYFEEWRPNTLVDDRRKPVEQIGQYESIQIWLDKYSTGNYLCSLDHFYRQDRYIKVWSRRKE